MAQGGAGRKVASTLMNAVLDSGMIERLRRRRPAALPEFLEALLELGPDAVLAHPAGCEDATLHLGRQWSTTTEVLAHPASLPAVVARREKVRVHPAAAYTTAATASGGSVFVVAGGAPLVLEAIAVVGVVGVTGLVSAWAWRPRASRKDRSFTVAGAAALTARSEALLVHQSTLLVHPDATRAAERQLAVVHGLALAVESAEAVAASGSLIDTRGDLLGDAETPAQRAQIAELITHRTRLVHALLRQQNDTQREEAAHRVEQQATYQQVVDDHDR